MKKTLFLMASMLALTCFSQKEKEKHNPPVNTATPSYTTVTYNNNSGQDLVIAFAQGALSGQGTSQTKWLKYDSKSHKCA